MGCSSSSFIGETARVRRRLEKTVVDLETPIDWDAPCTRPIKDFALYETRLQMIDYEQIIGLEEDWKDETFPLTQASLLDSGIRKESRHQRWEGFTWKRP